MFSRKLLFGLILIDFYLVFCLDLTKNCGKSKVNVTDSDWRIVGGKNALPGEYPWQVLLTRVYTNSFGVQQTQFCGGSIINEHWIITAAHCVANSDKTQEYTVRLGVVDLNSDDETQLSVGVDKIIDHKEYNSLLLHNDIALVKLKAVIDFEKHTNLGPICLAIASTELNKDCVATGFGLKSARGPRATVLQKVLEPLAEVNYCEKIHINFDSIMNVCAGGSSEGGTGTCMGDSGGPLQCLSTDGKWYQVGITSYGIPCARPKGPDVFTNVIHYNDWIKTTVSQN